MVETDISKIDIKKNSQGQSVYKEAGSFVHAPSSYLDTYTLLEFLVPVSQLIQCLRQLRC